MRTKYGFTLIELIVVIAIMGVLTLIITDTLIQTLRGENKVKILNQVKQNGQVVLDTMLNEIRRAKTVICIGDYDNDNIDDTIVIFGNEVYTRFRYVKPFPTDNPTANGYIRRDDFTDQTSVMCSSEDIGSLQSFILSSTDPLNGVSIKQDGLSPIFSENARSGYSSIITIRFRVAEGVRAGRTYETAVEEGGVLFTTTVQVRGGR